MHPDQSPHSFDPQHPQDPVPVPPPVIEADGVSVTAAHTVLLPPTTLHVGPGRIVALRGENGSGKTTLLRTMAGRIRPTIGTVRVGGRPVDERDPSFRRRVAVMIGLPPLARDLTVRDHVALVSSTWERTPDAVDAAVDGVLDACGLRTLATRFPHELSSGQTQLLGLALVLVRPFDLLLLDEPEQHLDPGRIELLARTLRARRARGATIIVATHSDGLAAATADLTVAPGARS